MRNVDVKLRERLGALSVEELEGMVEAGQEVFEVHRVLTKTQDNIVGELIKQHPTFYEWDHYPPGDVYDHDTHAQYYYHAHPQDQRFKREHGHFHTFLRPKGMPKDIKPAKLPKAVMPEDPNDALCHLVAVSMMPSGLSFRLFTVNRWVTGEVWYHADDVIRLLDSFEIDHAKPSWPVNRWISSMLPLFKPQIIDLLYLRDRIVGDWQGEHPEVDVYEDRELEVTSYVDINVEKQVREVAQALLARQEADKANK